MVTAADIRRWYLDHTGRTQSFCGWLQHELGLGVLLEPEWMTPKQIEERGGISKIPPHIHVQLKIQPYEVGFTLVD
jgi:hypothetical protein